MFNTKVNKDTVHMGKGEKPQIEGLGQEIEDLTKKQNGNGKGNLTENRINEANVPGNDVVLSHLKQDSNKNNQGNKVNLSKTKTPPPPESILSMSIHLPRDWKSLPALIEILRKDLSSVPPEMVEMINFHTTVLTGHFFKTVAGKDALEQVFKMFPEGFQLPAVSEEIGFSSEEIEKTALTIVTTFIGNVDANDKLEELTVRLKKVYPYHTIEDLWYPRIQQQACTIALSVIENLEKQIAAVQPAVTDYDELVKLVEEGFKISNHLLLESADAEKLKAQFESSAQKALDFLVRERNEKSLSLASQLVARINQIYAPAPIVS